MYILHVAYEVKEGMRGPFLNKLKELGIAEKSLAEEGNYDYTYYIPVNDENGLFLTEVWESMEAQKKHTGTEHFKALAAIKDTYVNKTLLKRFDGAVEL